MRTEVSQENWHKCECHFLDGTRLWCSRCTKCIQRGSIVYGYKMTKAQPKTRKNADPTDQHTKLEEIGNVAQWIKHQKITRKSLPKDDTSWNEEVFKKEHPNWKLDSKKVDWSIWRVLGRSCDFATLSGTGRVCDKEVPRQSKLDLCENHKRLHSAYESTKRSWRYRGQPEKSWYEWILWKESGFSVSKYYATVNSQR